MQFGGGGGGGGGDGDRLLHGSAATEMLKIQSSAL